MRIKANVENSRGHHGEHQQCDQPWWSSCQPYREVLCGEHRHRHQSVEQLDDSHLMLMGCTITRVCWLSAAFDEVRNESHQLAILMKPSSIPQTHLWVCKIQIRTPEVGSWCCNYWNHHTDSCCQFLYEKHTSTRCWCWWHESLKAEPVTKMMMGKKCPEITEHAHTQEAASSVSVSVSEGKGSWDNSK